MEPTGPRLALAASALLVAACGAATQAPPPRQVAPAEDPERSYQLDQELSRVAGVAIERQFFAEDALADVEHRVEAGVLIVEDEDVNVRVPVRALASEPRPGELRWAWADGTEGAADPRSAPGGERVPELAAPSVARDVARADELLLLAVGLTGAAGYLTEEEGGVRHHLLLDAQAFPALPEPSQATLDAVLAAIGRLAVGNKEAAARAYLEARGFAVTRAGDLLETDERHGLSVILQTTANGDIFGIEVRRAAAPSTRPEAGPNGPAAVDAYHRFAAAVRARDARGVLAELGPEAAVWFEDVRLGAIQGFGARLVDPLTQLYALLARQRLRERDLTAADGRGLLTRAAREGWLCPDGLTGGLPHTVRAEESGPSSVSIVDLSGTVVVTVHFLSGRPAIELLPLLRRTGATDASPRAPAEDQLLALVEQLSGEAVTPALLEPLHPAPPEPEPEID